MACNYSWQKPMGRPRKRRREGDAQASQSASGSGSGEGPPAESEGPSAPDFTVNDVGQSDDDLLTLDSLSFMYPQADTQLIFGDPAMFPDVQLDMLPLDASGDDTQPSTETPASNALTSPYPPSTAPSPCACLSNLSLALSQIQDMQATFPVSLTVLRAAMRTATTTISCRQCDSAAFAPSFQNTMLLGTLLPLIAEGYGRVLSWVDAEAATGKKKTMRMGEQSAETTSMHTGMPDCPMGFEIEMYAPEWRRLTRRVVLKDVTGSDSIASASSSGNDGSQERTEGGLLGIVAQLAKRQEDRHARHDALIRSTAATANGVPLAHAHDTACPGSALNLAGAGEGGREPLCLRIIQNVRDVVRRLEIDT
ncbi:MAG: hypothetical protein M1832_004835 [Thelocarpon impressellum]|nr:MAG: hypothetical protein M1832_004835 [Thelocarpon impressellum]